MKRLGLIKLSHDMLISIEDLNPWKEISLQDIKKLIQNSNFKIQSFVFLSTCNRVELIYIIENSDNHLDFYAYLIKHLPSVVEKPELITGRPVIKHLLKLSAGLESMVLGETEIRHQMKQALQSSVEENVVDSQLLQLFQSVFRESKGIRKKIPANLPLSISSIGIRKLEEELGGLASHNELFIVIGSGVMSKNSIEYLKKWGAKHIIWVNRSLNKIKENAESLQVPYISLKEFYDIQNFRNQFSLPVRAIITATSSRDPIIRKDFIKSLSYQQLVIIDLALPPDVEDAVRDVPYVKVINLQTIKELLEKNKKRREESMLLASNMIEDSLYRIESDWITSLSKNIIIEIQQKIFDHSRKKLNYLLNGNLSHLNNRDKRILYDWAIKFHREMNRIHKVGLEKVIKNYYINQKWFEHKNN